MLTTYITIDDDIRSFLNTPDRKNFCEKGYRYRQSKHFKPQGVFVEKGLLRLHPQTLDNTNQSAKVLPSTKKKTLTNAQNPKVSKPNCFSKAKKRTVKATPNERTEAAKQIAKTVH